MYLSILSICAVIVFLLYLRMSKIIRYQRLTANIPEVKSFPIIGSVLEFGETGIDILKNIDSFTSKFGSISKSWLGPYLLIGITSPEIIGEILSNEKLIDKPHSYRHFFPLVEPTTIFVSSGNLWRKRRKLLAPAFHFQMFEKYLNVFNLNSKVYVKSLKSEIGKSSFDICQYSNICTLDIITEILLGMETGIHKTKKENVVKSLHYIEKAFMYRVMRPWLYPNVIFFLSRIGKKANECLKLLYSFVDEIIELKESEICTSEKCLVACDKADIIDGDLKSANVTKDKTLLRILLEERENGTLSKKEVKDELLTFIIGGYATNASTLSFAVYYLMKHQEVQDKIVNELNGIFSGSDRDLTMGDLQKMTYLEMFIKETLRLYSPAPYVTREMKTDVQLKSGYTLPKGSFVSLHFYNVHRRADLYPNPEVFDPERFNYENSSKRNFYAFLPFCGGSRICIGHRVAMIEIKAILSQILRKYRILPPTDHCPDIKLAFEMVLRSTTGVHVRIEER